MEFIKGKVIDPLEDISAIEKIAGVLDYFATLRHSIPGSLSGGFCRGLLFPETEDLVFDSLDGMEKWFNSRLFAHNLKLTLQGCELVFCHLDIVPRNILWQENRSLCLVDWASAGYYPRLFEFCSQWIIEGKDGSFNSLLLNSMKPLSDQEDGTERGHAVRLGKYPKKTPIVSARAKYLLIETHLLPANPKM